MVLSAELMLHGVSLTLVTFGQLHNSLEGQAFTIFILTVAACEAGLALSLILALYQKSKSLDIELWTELREADLPPPMAEEDRDGPPCRPACSDALSAVDAGRQSARLSHDERGSRRRTATHRRRLESPLINRPFVISRSHDAEYTQHLICG